jgi:hypothetical protein
MSMTLKPGNTPQATRAVTTDARRQKRAALGLAMLGFAVVVLDAQITMSRCLRFTAASAAAWRACSGS